MKKNVDMKISMLGQKRVREMKEKTKDATCALFDACRWITRLEDMLENGEDENVEILTCHHLEVMLAIEKAMACLHYYHCLYWIAKDSLAENASTTK